MANVAQRVLITGITGFLGAAVAKEILKNGFSVIGMRRNDSDLFRVADIKESIEWVNAEDPELREALIRLQPDIIVHAAWSGVNAGQRDDLTAQLFNLQLIGVILDIARVVPVKMFIGLGSQAEYGRLTEAVDEQHDLQPLTAYGITKKLAAALVADFCRVNSISWFWLRVFSVFGETESGKWFIPSVINKMLDGEAEIQMTSGMQKYAYLYINDFARMLQHIIEQGAKEDSGIYNISATSAIPLKQIVHELQVLIPEFKGQPVFGSIPERELQSVHLEGKMDKYFSAFGKIEFKDTKDSLKEVVMFHRQIRNKK